MGNAEPGCDLFGRHALFLVEFAEGGNLLGGMHGRTLEVFSQRDFRLGDTLDKPLQNGNLVVLRHLHAENGAALRLKVLEGAQAASPCQNLKLALPCRFDVEALDQAMRGDVGGQGLNPGLGVEAANVRLARDQLGQCDGGHGHWLSP
jgi:hypothetical protein